jgi:FMN phosphatase YigB (HAD superfamily)
MLKNILLDLDDTLLDTNIDNFLPHYFKALGEKLSEFLPPDTMINLVLHATHEMMTNIDPGLTNENVFAAHFFHHIPFSEEKIKAKISDFYEIEFPKLKIHTNTISDVREMVIKLLNANKKITIATNPLFPARAIEHRINWAGLGGLNFDLITTFENSHFCKPNLLYYGEVLKKLNADPAESIMVGNDEMNDIIPAKEAGLFTFRIGNGKTSADASGTLEDALEFILRDGLI